MKVASNYRVSSWRSACRLLLAVITAAVMAAGTVSCVSSKTVTYFQTTTSADTARHSLLPAIKPVVSRIQAGDILAVVVTSMSEESNALFNTYAIAMSSGVAGGNGSQGLGYLVSPAGRIELALLGSKVALAGLTLDDAAALIKDRLNKYIKEPKVNVRFLNHKCTVLGEVLRPGVFPLANDYVTLPELMALAGDLTVYGRRDNVMLVRTQDNGQREVVRLDLRDRNILNSPYYYIRNDDMVYVEARGSKVTTTDRFYQVTPLAFGVLGTVLTVINFFRR